MNVKIFLSVLILASTFYFHSGIAQTCEYKWAVNAIGTGDDRGFKISADDHENIVLTGRYNGKEIRFGNITLTNSDQDKNSSDMFIAKYNSNTEVLWAKSIGGLGDEFGTDCQTDSKGNIILIGNFDCEQFTIGNSTLTNKTVKGEGGDILIIKYDQDGKVIWAKSLGGAKHDGGYATCAIDKEDNIYVTGQFYSPKFIIDSLELTKSKVRGADVFLAKYSSAGKLIWAKSSRGPDTFDSESQSCAVDKNGNIVISGLFFGPYISFEQDTLKKNAEKSNNIFVAKYSPSGKLIWANSYGGSIATSRVDAKGNIVLAGIFADSVLTIGKISLLNNGDGDLYITKLNPQGKVLWAKSAGGELFEGARNFCIDSKGNSILTGSFASPVWTLGNTTIMKDTTTSTSKNEARTEDIFIAAYSKKGKVIWAKFTGGKGRNAGRSCAADKKGNIYVTGSFDVDKLTLGSLTLTNSGDSDVFIVKLSQK